MFHQLWSAKPGAGVTTVAVLLAAASARAGRPVLLVDLCGDVPIFVAHEPGPAPGITDWLRTAAPASALHRIERQVDDLVSYLPRGGSYSWAPERAESLRAALEAESRHVVVDLGTVAPDDPSPMADLRRRWSTGSTAYLVSRTCYISLRRAAACGRPAGVVVVREPGRSLDHRDVAEVLGVPVVARIDMDPSVARAIDAGRLLTRPPRLASNQIGRLVR